MKKIIITATAESIEQVEQLLEAGVDRIYVGEKDFGKGEGNRQFDGEGENRPPF